MQLAKAMTYFNPKSNSFGAGGSATNKVERIEWQDVCIACSALSDQLPFKLALIKYQGEWSVAGEVYPKLLSWAREVPWHSYAPGNKRFKLSDDRLKQLIRAAVWEFSRIGPCMDCKGTGKNLDDDKDCRVCHGSGYSRINTSQLAHRAEMKRNTFKDWNWCYMVILDHVMSLESELARMINRKLH